MLFPLRELKCLERTRRFNQRNVSLLSFSLTMKRLKWRLMFKSHIFIININPVQTGFADNFSNSKEDNLASVSKLTWLNASTD
jgi:hypothetical protein